MEEKEASASTSQKKRRFKRICVFCGSRAGYKPIYGDAALELGKVLVEREVDLVYGGGSVGLMGIISKTVFQGSRHVLGVIPRPLLPHEIVGETYGQVKIVADMHQRKSEMEKNADAFIALPGGYGTMEELLEVITWSQLGIHEKPVRTFTTLQLHSFCPKLPPPNIVVPGHMIKQYFFGHGGTGENRGGSGDSEGVVFGTTVSFDTFVSSDVVIGKQVGLLNVGGYFNSLLALFDKGVEEGFIDDSARSIVILGDTAEELLTKMEEYAPAHDRVAPRQSWETNQLLDNGRIN